MVLAKEKINLFMKGQGTDLDAVYEKFGVDYNLLAMLLRKGVDKDGHLYRAVLHRSSGFHVALVPAAQRKGMIIDMRRKRSMMLCTLGIVAAITLTGIIGIIFFNNKENCYSIELREQRLGQLDNLGIVNIESEITIDRHIISGYTSSNGSYGVAVFEPAYRGNYKFQSNINNSGSEILVTTIVINGVVYDLFWANIADLDFAQITYATSSGCKEYKLDASNNEVLYLQAPYNNYTVSSVFFTQNGDCHE